MLFYLGTHVVRMLVDPASAGVPLFYSFRVLGGRKSAYARSGSPWALDSGGFTELILHGRWTLPARSYAAGVRRLRDELGSMAWACPQDWVCAPAAREKTGLAAEEHLQRTVASVLELRALAPDLPWVPVLQGWDARDYERCAELYDRAGLDLRRESVVAIGSIASRQGEPEVEAIVRQIAGQGIRLHALGAKTAGLHHYHDVLASADSMAWSFRARREPPIEGHTHKSCANCPTYALGWRERLLASMTRPHQLSLVGTG